MKKIIAIIALAAAFTGCASAPQQNFASVSKEDRCKSSAQFIVARNNFAQGGGDMFDQRNAVYNQCMAN